MLGIIGGTALSKLNLLTPVKNEHVETPWGVASSALSFGTVGNTDVVFLARHGHPHQVSPHQINYRANLSALKQVGVSQIVAVNAVGGINTSLGPTEIAIPDQIIDYTYCREHTIFDGGSYPLKHIDFTDPYDKTIRIGLAKAAKQSGIDVFFGGVHGVTQGPRLETAAEIEKYQKDGCDLIGMTGMPEAALAREFELDYACLALSVNWCAGIGESNISLSDIHQAVENGMDKVNSILAAFVQTNY